MNCALKNGKKKGGGAVNFVLYIFYNNEKTSFVSLLVFLTAPAAYGIPGQASHPSCTCNLCHSFSNAGSLTHCTTGEFPKTVLKNLNGCRIEKELQRLQETGSKVLAAVQDRDGDG